MSDSDPRSSGEWLALNARYAKLWPNITQKGQPPADADAWNGTPNKKSDLDPQPNDETAVS